MMIKKFQELLPGDKFMLQNNRDSVFVKLCRPINSHVNAVNIISGYGCHITQKTDVMIFKHTKISLK